MMAFAPPKSMDGPKMQTKMSTWTPLNHQLLNDQVFEERRALLGKWFDKWTDSQRRRILTGLFERCSLSQQKFCCRKLQEKIPAEALDFTTKLPRVLSLYIFSFLDPRSLCRCAQVSWHWKTLTELDQLWMLKCLRFNWYINFSPTPLEQGIWKKHYIQRVKELHVTKPKTPPKDGFVIADVQPVTGSSPEGKQSPSSTFRPSSSLRKKNHPGEKELPPWRSSDKHPTDIIRFNYLDNCDPIEQIWRGRKKRHEMAPDSSQQTHDKKNKLQDRSKLRKAQSLKQSGLGRKRSTLSVVLTEAGAPEKGDQAGLCSLRGSQADRWGGSSSPNFPMGKSVKQLCPGEEASTRPKPGRIVTPLRLSPHKGSPRAGPSLRPHHYP